MTEQLAAQVLEGDLDARCSSSPKRGVGARHHPIAADLDRRTFRDTDDTQIVGDRTDGCSLGDVHQGDQPRGGTNGCQATAGNLEKHAQIPPPACSQARTATVRR